ncbi:hypothetical protein BDR26DRAFT_855833 [Obelidium mucronatum]|nr:hypothetical protein BDR26DRAFT_855833 [Obelidium mucronatum]
MQTDNTTTDIAALGIELQQLRQIKGHFSGGSDGFIKDVDAFNGKKHQILDRLLTQLGVPGTLLSKISETMGIPDEVVPEGDASIVSLMPGPILVGGGSATQSHQAVTCSNADSEVSVYAIYHWRGRHDYVWFLIGTEGTVVKSGWYMAGE